MISFFRRALSSWLVLGLLALVMIAFIITGVSGPRTLTGGATGDSVAKVGGEDISSAELASRVQFQLDQSRQQTPGLDMGALVKSGGVDQIADQLVNARAMEVWGRKQGFSASDRLVDGEIASIQAFKGPTGKFDRQTFDSVLSQRKISERQLRQDIAGDALRRQILFPVAAVASAPVDLVKPYASLLLESRTGLIGIVPTAAMGEGNPPSAAEIGQYYTRNIARYTIPERRVLRYALFGGEQAKAAAKPTEAEVAAFYKNNASSYAGSELRTLSQVILPDQAAAQAFAAKAKGPEGFVKAAAGAGFAASDVAIGAQSKAAFASLASPAAAAAAFALPSGGVSDPVKSELGWHVIHVDAIKATPGHALDQVRGEIVASIEKQKTDEALADAVSAIEDAIANGSTFEDVVKSEKLTAVTTPALLPDGSAPDLPGFKPAPEIPLLLKSAFQAATDDDPTVETIGDGRRYALLKVTQIVASAPAPLAKVRDAVVRDLLVKRAADRARSVAAAIVAKANAGIPLDKAIAEAGARLPPPQRAGGRQIDLARPNQPIPPPLAMMFSMTQGKTKLLAAPNNQGWFIVHLDTITPGDAATAPGLVDATRQQFARVIGDEYAEQFSKAVARDIGVSKNADAITRLKTRLTGGTDGQ